MSTDCMSAHRSLTDIRFPFRVSPLLPNMMKEPAIGIGLIGVGRHGIRYARHIMQDIPSASLVAVCRQHPEQGLDLPGSESVNIYGNARSLIEDPRVDAVVVVTPPIYSRDICLLAIQARKPVLIEKPLSTSADDARAMMEAATRAAVPLMTGHTLRFDSTIQAMQATRHMIGRSQRLHLTSHIETKERGPAHADGYGKRGALLEVGVHMLDLVRFLTGEEVCEVRCTMDVVPPVAPESAASVQLITQRGTECRVDVRRVAAGRTGSAVWIGSDGQLTADWTQQRLQWAGAGNRTETWTLVSCPTIVATMSAFLEALRRKQAMPITGEDGFRAVEIAEACYRSAQAGGATVRLPLM